MVKPYALLLLAGLTAAACSSPAARRAPGADRQVALHDYRNRMRFRLLDDASHSRVEQYSQLRTDANTKVLTAEVMDALSDYLHSNGFDEFAVPGALPEQVTQGVAWGLELRDGAEVRSVLGYPPGLTNDQQQRVRALRVAFLETYNHTYSLQAVEVKPGETPFKAPEPPRPPNR